MDSLLKNIRDLSLNRDDGLDELVDQLNSISCLGKKRSALEYQELQNNYSKLLYLDDFFKKLTLDNRELLMEPLLKFLESIDVKTNYYFEQIYFFDESAELYTETSKIGNYLNKALYLKNPFEKMKYIILAYSNIIEMFDDQDTINLTIDDHPFLETFSSKRSKK